MSSRAYWAAKCELNTERFHEYLAKLVKISARGAREVTLEAARKFAAAAQKSMPPDPGKAKISAGKAYREIVEMEGDFFAGRSGYFRKLRYHDGLRFMVPFAKTHDGARLKGKKFFADRAEAERFSAIKYTGAARSGWGQAVKALGGRMQNFYPAGFPHKAAVNHLLSVAGSTQKNERTDGFSIEVENHAHSAGDYWLLRSESEGRYKAGNALKREIRKIEKEMEHAG
jgi:hypothetical protein